MVFKWADKDKLFVKAKCAPTPYTPASGGHFNFRHCGN